MIARQSVADILRDHVRLSVEGIDRMYLNVYVPQLQSEQGVVRFFKYHRGQPLPSAALMSPLSRGFVAQLERFVARDGISLVQFRKGERKDAVMAEHLTRFAGEEGVLFVGKAQEKTPVFRTEKRRSPTTGRPYPWIVRSSAMVNHYYVYAVDRDFGPFFLKFCSYFPYNAKLCLNGHEYAKRQLAKEGIAFEALDNGVLSCADPAAAAEDLRRPVGGEDRCAPAQVAAPAAASVHWRRPPGRLPLRHLDPASRVLADPGARPPQHGRLFFEQVIRENLDLGRPEQVQLIFKRRVQRNTPGLFRTRVLTEEVTPSLHVDYKNTRIKQYHKENRALRTETTINNTHDFGIGKRLHNLPSCARSALRPTAASSRSNASATTACSPRHTFQAVNGPVTSGAPARLRPALRRSAHPPAAGRPSSCSGSSRTASAQPICATILRPCPPALPKRSPKAPPPISCAACACTA